MNRRDFLKVVTASVAVVAAPYLIPADAKFVLDAKNETVIGNAIRTVDWHADWSAYFVGYQAKINGADYYVVDFSDEIDAKTLRMYDENAMKAFKRSSDLKSKIARWKSTRKITKSEMRGDFPPYGV